MVSKTVRNASILAMATATVAGSIVPANAFAVASPVEAAATFSAPTLASYSYQPTTEYSYTYESAPATFSTQSQSSTPVAASALNGSRSAILAAAYDGIGGSYIWGGKGYKAWDCSGFVSHVFAQSGINLTAYTYAMATELVPTSTPQPGDIVFTNGYAHVGIYVGDGKMISALNPLQGTLETSVDGGGFMPVDGYYTVAGL